MRQPEGDEGNGFAEQNGSLIHVEREAETAKGGKRTKRKTAWPEKPHQRLGVSSDSHGSELN